MRYKCVREKAEEEERKKALELQDKFRKDYERRLNPKTDGDYNFVFHLLEGRQKA